MKEVRFLSADEKKQSCKIAVGFAGKDEIESYMRKIDEVSSKRFEEYIIAYIDFLGMKERMKQEKSFESLHVLKFILAGVQYRANSISSLNTIDNFDIKVFSDNVIIAQKIDKHRISNQIISIINLVSLIQFEAFFQFDFSLRGGITIGELSIDNSVVWGTGLMDAYKMESSYAIFPRVIVSEKTINTYQTEKDTSINLFSMIKQDADGLWFVDYLLAAPNLQLIPEMSESLRDKASSHACEDIRVRQKINWTIQYFNSFCRQFKDRGNYEQYVVPYI